MRNLSRRFTKVSCGDSGWLGEAHRVRDNGQDYKKYARIDPILKVCSESTDDRIHDSESSRVPFKEGVIET